MARISSRRDFLRKTAALTGGAVAASAAAAPLSVPPSAQEPGRPIPEAMYGMPSKYEAHVARRRRWALFEGADAAAHARSIPMEKVLGDAIIAYAMNGERLRPENGYPVRFVLPGWEGNTSVKWLRRIKVSDEPWHLRSETARYTDPMPEGKWRQFSMVMECKSVITSPSGGQQLKGPGFYEIAGLAWSGAGRIRAVDVSVDGGRNWREAMVEEP